MGTKARHVPSDYQDLYETYFDPRDDTFVRGLTRRYAGSRANDADVEDLMHETFARMLRLKQLEKFDASRGNFGLFLQQIIRSVVFNWHAKNGRTPTHLRGPVGEDGEAAAWETEVDEAPSPEDLVLFADLERCIRRIAEGEADAGAELRDVSLAPMVALLSDGREAKDVAAELEVSPSTITHWRRHLRGLVAA